MAEDAVHGTLKQSVVPVEPLLKWYVIPKTSPIIGVYPGILPGPP